MGSSPLFLPYAYAIAIADKIPVKLNTELDTALNQSENCGPHNLIQNSDQPGIGKLPIRSHHAMTLKRHYFLASRQLASAPFQISFAF